MYVVTAAFRLPGCPHWQALSTLLGTLITWYTRGYISELLQANQTRLYLITSHTSHILNQTTNHLSQFKLESSLKLQTRKCWDSHISQLICPRLSAPLLLKNADPSLGSSHPWRLLLRGESLCNWFNSELKDWNKMYVQKIFKQFTTFSQKWPKMPFFSQQSHSWNTIHKGASAPKALIFLVFK